MVNPTVRVEMWGVSNFLYFVLLSETRVTSGGTKEDFVRNSLNITGTAVGLAKDTYTIDANNQGITINGTTIAWSEVKDNNGNVINDNSIVESSYAFEYNGLTISFNTNVDTTIEDVINAIAGTKFQIDENSIQKNVVSISNVSIAPGTVADEILVGNPLVERKRLYFKADDEGISIQLGSDPPYTKKTWAELGIDDWSNAGGKSFNFTDSVTGVSFTGTIEANTSKEKVIESMNGIFFEWDYIDRNVSTDTFKGITVSSNDGTITNNFSDIKLTELWFQHEYGTISGLYSDMGYTTPSDIMNGVELRITLETGNANNYILKATSEKGAEKSITLNTSDLFDGRNFLQFGGQSNTNEKATITTSGKYAANKKLELLYNYVGQGNKIEIATVTLPSPYEYSLVPNKVTSIQMYMSGFTTNGGNTVNPPASTPSTPNQPIPPIQNPSGELDKVPDGKLCLWIQSGCDAGDGMFLEIDRMNTSILGIDDIDVSTSEGANHTLDVIGGALEKVSSNRAKIGAQQNRLEHTIANKENIVENTTAAESRIRDTDMADFMVKLSKENILEQVGQSMLAQANQSTSAVLNLLK